jgi:hypothetical protein
MQTAVTRLRYYERLISTGNIAGEESYTTGTGTAMGDICGRQCAVVSTGSRTQAERYRSGLVRNTYTFPIRKIVVCGEERSDFSTMLGSVVHTNGWLLKLVLYLTAARPLKLPASRHTRRPAVEKALEPLGFKVLDFLDNVICQGISLRCQQFFG